MFIHSKATQKLLQPPRIDDTDIMHVELNREGSQFIIHLSNTKYNTASWAARKFLARFPEQRRLTDGKLSVAATDYSACIIVEAWPEGQLQVAPDAKIVLQYLISNVLSEEGNAVTTAEFRESGKLPLAIYADGENPLAPYQKVALHNSMKGDYALFMEQGTGKTAVAIANICNRAIKKDYFKTLIVCPKNVRSNWQHEFAKFASIDGRVRVMRGGAIERVKSLIDVMRFQNGEKWAALICSYESLVGSWEAIKEVEWDLSVLDESHYIKSPRTRRWRYCEQLRDVSKNRMILTGTPITNSMLDLYTQLEFLERGASGFQSWDHFRRFHGVYANRGGFEALTAVQNVPLMQERLARKTFLIRKEDALPDLPDKVYDVHEVEMTAEQLDFYNNVSEQLMLEIEGVDLTNRMTVNNVLTRLLRLAQITSGFLTWDEIRDETGETLREQQIDYVTPNPKIEGLLELLSGKAPNEKTIVWACWRADVERISEALMLAGIGHVTFTGSTSDKDRAEAEFLFNNNSDCKVFLGNPAAGGTGLNLLGYNPNAEVLAESNANHVIYFSQNWSSTARSQSEDRAHRRGTREPVRITDLCVPNSIDEEIRARVVDKRLGAMTIQDLRKVLRSLIK